MNDTQDAAPEEKGRDSSKAVSIPRERQDPDDVVLDSIRAGLRKARESRLAEEHKKKEQLPKK